MGFSREAMTSRYRRPFRYPDGFADVLRDFTREVLRDQPKSIPEYGAAYFDRILKQSAEQQVIAEEGSGAPDRMSQEQLLEYLSQVFMEADVDGSGSLSYKEFKRVLATANFQFSKEDVRRMLMEADENDDGCIDYNEFLPIGVDIVQSIYARREAQAAKEAMDSEVQTAARTALLHGMTKQQYSDLLLTYFKAHAGDAGVLSREQFKQALQNAELGLTRHEINLIMAEVDSNNDGVIDVSEFDNVFFEMLVECISLVLAEEVRGSDELTTYLLEIFRGADLSSQGLLHKIDVVDLLKRGDFGLTKIQTLAVMAEAEIDENGFVDYEKLAPLAASIIRSIWDQNADYDRAVYMEGQEASGEQIFGRDAQEVYDTVLAAFHEFDADRNGHLDPTEFKQCLMQTELLGRPLTDKEFTAVLAAVDEDQDGKISYEEFLKLVLEVMQYFWEQDAYQAATSE